MLSHNVFVRMSNLIVNQNGVFHIESQITFKIEFQDKKKDRIPSSLKSFHSADTILNPQSNKCLYSNLC